MDRKHLELAKNSLTKVAQYRLSGNYGRAFAHYLVFLELNASNSLSDHEIPFIEVLTTWCLSLESTDDVENLCKCYLQGLHYFPNSIAILNSFGGQLLRLGQQQDALKYFKIAHNLNNNHLPSEKNLASAKAAVVEQWHFRMLNDKVRNLGYYKAFQYLLNENYNFALDIGTGSGLLTLLASKAYKEKNISNFQIVAFELSNTLSNIATEVFRANDANEHVTLINAESTALNKVNYANDQRNMVLFTEIFDTALFGEHVLSTIIHAHENLLSSSPNQIIIPMSADLYIFGASCPDLSYNKTLQRNAFAKCDLKLPDCDIKVNFEGFEPYDAYDITKHNFKKVTNVHKVLTVDFNDLNQLRRLYTLTNAISSFNLEFCESNYLCDCFILYFDLHLDPNNTISTNPFKEDSCKCWEQAIIYIEHPIETIRGKCIENVTISTVNNKLQLKFQETNRRKDTEIVLQEGSIKFLNDYKLIEAFEHCVSKLMVNKEYVVLDMNPVPIFGLLALKSKNIKLTTVTKEREFVLCLCELNKIPVENIKFLDPNNLLEHFCKNQHFDIIAFEPVLKNGVLNEEFYSKVDIFRSVLNEDGFFLPMNVEIHWQIVQSDYLDLCTKVSDENVMRFDISRHINEFSVLEVWDLNLNFKFDKLCDLQKTVIDFTEKEIINETTITFFNVCKDFKANSTYYYFDLDFMGFKVNSGISNITFASLAAFIFETPVEFDDRIHNKVFIVKQHAGLLKIYPK